MTAKRYLKDIALGKTFHAFALTVNEGYLLSLAVFIIGSKHGSSFYVI